MITDADLDLRNYCKKKMTDKETIVYLHTDGTENGDYTTIFMGEEAEMVSLLLEATEIHDVVLNVAAHLVLEHNIDFNEVLDGVKKLL